MPLSISTAASAAAVDPTAVDPSDVTYLTTLYLRLVVTVKNSRSRQENMSLYPAVSTPKSVGIDVKNIPTCNCPFDPNSPDIREISFTEGAVTTVFQRKEMQVNLDNPNIKALEWTLVEYARGKRAPSRTRFDLNLPLAEGSETRAKVTTGKVETTYEVTLNHPAPY